MVLSLEENPKKLNAWSLPENAMQSLWYQPPSAPVPGRTDGVSQAKPWEQWIYNTVDLKIHG